jgi:protein TonB
MVFFVVIVTKCLALVKKTAKNNRTPMLKNTAKKGSSMTRNSIFSQTAIMFIGALVTLCLFVFMAQLVKNDQAFIGQATEAPVLHFLQDIPEPIPPKSVQRLAPEPVTPRPTITSIPSIESGGVDIGPEMIAPVMPASTESYNKGLTSSDAMPVIQVSPQYPIGAARDGKEGYVIVAFDISTLGAANVKSQCKSA